MSDNKCAQDEKYLEELKRLRDHETKNRRVKKFLDTEILNSEKKTKYHELLNDKKKVVKKLQSLEELLEVTSSTVLREDLNQMILPLKKEVQRLTDEIVKPEMTKAEFKNLLIQCEEMLAVILFSLSDGSEFEKEAAKPAKESPWLMLCQAETGLDSHQSGLPTTTLTKYAFDESEEFAKIYVDVLGLEESDENKLKPTFSERHFSLLVVDVGGRNYKIHFTNLTEAVDVAKSKTRPKKDRVVVFLKKKQPITWRNLTAVSSSSKKKASERLRQDATSTFYEFVTVYNSLTDNTTKDQRDEVMMKNGLYTVRDVPSAKKTMALIDEFPPRLCFFRWEDKSPGAKEILHKALRAVSQKDCFLHWGGDNTWADRKRYFDDEQVKIITSEKGNLVNFSGRLSSQCWSLVPASTLSVTAIVTCADDIRALSSCPVFERFCVDIEPLMPLSEVKALRTSASKDPITLMFSNMTDVCIEWLLKAVDILRPLMAFPNNQQERQIFQVMLPGCLMTPGGHIQLCLRLVPEVVRVEVHDFTNVPKNPMLAQMYAIRRCKFDYVNGRSAQAQHLVATVSED